MYDNENYSLWLSLFVVIFFCSIHYFAILKFAYNSLFSDFNVMRNSLFTSTAYVVLCSFSHSRDTSTVRKQRASETTRCSLSKTASNHTNKNIRTWEHAQITTDAIVFSMICVKPIHCPSYFKGRNDKLHEYNLRSGRTTMSTSCAQMSRPTLFIGSVSLMQKVKVYSPELH